MSCVVVGGGVAGLSAARAVQAAGYTVTVLEARPRLGGRCCTDTTSLGVPVDLGASWLHGASGHSLRAVVEALGVPTHKTSASDSILFDHDLESFMFVDVDGAVIPKPAVMRAVKVFDALTTACRDLAAPYAPVWPPGSDVSNSPPPPRATEGADAMAGLRSVLAGGGDVSLRDGLHAVVAAADVPPDLMDGTTPESRMLAWFMARWEGWFAAGIELISLRWHDSEELVEGGHRIVVPGYSTLVEELAAPLDVRLGDAVVDIARKDGRAWTAVPPCGVVVTTASRCKYEADAVVVALPAGVLKAHHGELFSPALPHWKGDAFEAVGIGCENKVILRFPFQFWENVAFLGALGATPANCAYFLNLAPVVGVPVLAYMPAGRTAEALEALDDEATVEHTMAILRRMFRNLAVPEPVGHVVTRWGRDPHSLGAYCYQPVGLSDAQMAALGEPVGALQFCGEHVCVEYQGTTHGAAVSALAAARGVIQRLAAPKPVARL